MSWNSNRALKILHFCIRIEGFRRLIKNSTPLIDRTLIFRAKNFLSKENIQFKGRRFFPFFDFDFALDELNCWQFALYNPRAALLLVKKKAMA